MLIQFDNIPEQVIPNFKGGEKSYAMRSHQDQLNRIMKGRLIPGATIGVHTHEDSSEVIFILEGQGKVLFDGEEIPLRAGDCHYCPKGYAHSLINNSSADLLFFAVVPQQ